MRSTELAVGDPHRRTAGVAILASLVVAVVFTAVTVLSKETPGLELRQPWQDDPYDVPVSLDFVVLPLLVGMGVLRGQLCRRREPLPARRLLDLLRVARVALVVSLATEAAEWVAVLVRAHQATWAVATAWQVTGLAVLTVAAIGAAVLVRRATRAVARSATAAAQPDWLADAVALSMRASRLLGRQASWVQTPVRWADAQVITRVRAHPVVAAGLVAGVLAVPFLAAKIILEGYPAPLMLFIAVFLTTTLFAVVVLVGAYLRVVAPTSARTPRWLSTSVAACLAGATGFALHDSLLGGQQTVGGLSALFLAAAVIGGLVSLVLQLLRRGHPNPKGVSS